MGLDLFSGLVGAGIAGLLAYIINKNDLNDSLDSKSGWREKIFDVASKSEIGYEDVYRIRAALRIEKHKAQEKLIPFSFDWMTNIMIDYFDKLINKRNNNVDPDGNEIIINQISTRKIHRDSATVNLLYINKEKNNRELKIVDQEIIRIFARYLLKHHWEFRISMGPKGIISKEKKNKVPQNYSVDAINQIIKKGSSYMPKELEKYKGYTFKTGIDKKDFITKTGAFFVIFFLITAGIFFFNDFRNWEILDKTSFWFKLYISIGEILISLVLAYLFTNEEYTIISSTQEK